MPRTYTFLLGAATLAVALFLSHATVAAQDDECAARDAEAARLYAQGEHREAARVWAGLLRLRCRGMDAILYNLASAYENARMPGRAIRVRSVLLERFPESSLTASSLFRLAADYHALAMYEEAATHYAMFAERYPDEVGDDCSTDARASGGVCANATQALENAIFFFRGLGARERAEAASALFIRSYGQRFPERAAAVAFAMGADLDDLEATETHTEDFVRDYAAVARLDLRARALLRLGTVRIALGRPADARAALEQIGTLVTTDAVMAIEGERDEVEIARYRAVSARDEAALLLVDLRRSRVGEAPAPRGRASVTTLETWASGALTRWRDRELARIEGIVAAYRAFLASSPLPRWELAAYRRIAEVYAGVLASAERVAPPSWAADDEELAEAFEVARERTLEGVVASARESYQACAELGRRPWARSEDGGRCEDALAELDPALDVTPRELHGQADWAGDGLQSPEPAPPSADFDEVSDDG